MTDLISENARLRAALAYMVNHAEWREKNEGVYWEATKIARELLATPAPDAVQAATRADRLADAAKTLLSVDEYGSRKEVYAACEGRVKVYKFDAALTRLSNARAPSQENAHDDA